MYLHFKYLLQRAGTSPPPLSPNQSAAAKTLKVVGNDDDEEETLYARPTARSASPMVVTRSNNIITDGIQDNQTPPATSV